MALQLRKAWEVIGYTRNGEVFCAGCAIASGANLVEDTQPVFASDETPPWNCSDCGAMIE